LSARQRNELRLFLRLLDSRPFLMAAARSSGPFTSLDEEAREDVLLRLGTSRLPQLRSGFQALKRLSTFLFYTVLDDSGRNLAWPALSYDVPEPAPGTSPLVVRRIDRDTVLDADACVVGSGAGGGVIAERLASAGLSVVVLEAGPADQADDFDQREIVGMQRLYLDRGTTATRDLGVAILAGSCIGGGTAVNWQTSLRPPDYIRDEWADRSGIRSFIDRPFDEALDAIWTRLNVGTGESVRNGNNAPLERGSRALGYHSKTIPRNARGCDLAQCGFCVYGCRQGGKQATSNTYLVDAQRNGDTVIVPQCRATRVRIAAGAATGVEAEALDPASGRTYHVTVSARVVAVAGGAIETPALLLRSGVAHPRLGRNLHLHPTTAVAGRYVEPVRGWLGAPQTVLCDELARVRGNHGVRFETAPLHPGLLALALPWYGAREHRRRMQLAAYISAFIVLTRDRSTGRVRVDREGRAVIDYGVGGMERELLQGGIAAAARLHWAAGATAIHTLHSTDLSLERRSRSRRDDLEDYVAELERAPVHGNRCGVFSAHQMGTCAMGSGSRTSVCDERGAVRGVKNLYVADASLFPASSGVNPMITVMAMAWMVGEKLGARGD
jgi:choline dehydrogenase-like flavoprotein